MAKGVTLAFALCGISQPQVCGGGPPGSYGVQLAQAPRSSGAGFRLKGVWASAGCMKPEM